jgi:hypothetical protein
MKVKVIISKLWLAAITVTLLASNTSQRQPYA